MRNLRALACKRRKKHTKSTLSSTFFRLPARASAHTRGQRTCCILLRHIPRLVHSGLLRRCRRPAWLARAPRRRALAAAACRRAKPEHVVEVYFHRDLDRFALTSSRCGKNRTRICKAKIVRPWPQASSTTSLIEVAAISAMFLEGTASTVTCAFRREHTAAWICENMSSREGKRGNSATETEATRNG